MLSLCLTNGSNLGEEGGETGMWGTVPGKHLSTTGTSGACGIGYPCRENSFEDCVGCLVFLFVNVLSSLASLGQNDYYVSLKCH